MPIASYCPRCGEPVREVAESVGECSGCGRRVYANARPAAGVFLVRRRDRAERNHAEEVLLIRRGVAPARGKWDIPGGFLNETEDPENGARREIHEELGLELGPLKLALVQVNPHPDGAVLDVLFEADAPAQEPRAASDVDAFAWFPIDDLPHDLAFAATRTALERWRATRGIDRTP